MTDKHIKLEQFEGPLALLLQLIETNELDVTTLSLAQVADQYIAILQEQEELNPEEVANFLLVAAKLLYIKSKVLSPDYFSAQDEQEDETDLARQLKMYKQYVEASRYIKENWHEENYFFSRIKPWRQPRPKFIPPKNIQAQDLTDLMQSVLRELEPIARLQVKKMNVSISIKEQIASIRQAVLAGKSFDFYGLIAASKNKTERIVNFLAILELVKQREVQVVQENIFANFTITKNNQ